MAIDFSAERWERIRAEARQWWVGELSRPLIHVNLSGKDPGRPAPVLSEISRDTAYDLNVSVENFVDRQDYELAGQQYLGDAFPHVWPDFGAGAIAAFLGAHTENVSGTVWFSPAHLREIKDIHFQFDPDNIWFNRVQAIMRTARERWQGLVQIDMTDLGGNLDILASFRPSEALLFDLYDAADEVKRLTWESHACWWRYFEEFNSLLQPWNPGYTAWTAIYSETPYYMLQCDFCYMLGPEMFAEFVLPELRATCKRLDHAFYHLDGPGELTHLDALLSIEELNGIQWIPGDGSPSFEQWPQVYRKIRDAGKLVQVWGPPSAFNTLVNEVGSAEGMVCFTGGSMSDQTEMEEFLRKYDVPIK
jgi:5-methyltetrahydrofolate--homocysteine methyltransferase